MNERSKESKKERKNKWKGRHSGSGRKSEQFQVEHEIASNYI